MHVDRLRFAVQVFFWRRILLEPEPLPAHRSTLNLRREADEQRYCQARALADLHMRSPKTALATFELRLLQDNSE
jgi:hypothetical protein